MRKETAIEVSPAIVPDITPTDEGVDIGIGVDLDGPEGPIPPITVKFSLKHPLVKKAIYIAGTIIAIGLMVWAAIGR